jgi:hypothetical protein
LGLQVGAEGKLIDLGPFSLNGTIKAGGYWNHASQSTVVSVQKILYNSGASTDRLAFVGEAGLHCKYEIIRNITLTFGYELLWLDGIATAPGQIQETVAIPGHASARGVNCGSNALFDGFTLGLSIRF